MRMGEIKPWERRVSPLRPWECFTEWLALGASIRERKFGEVRFSQAAVGMKVDS
jgi:hypothetical protein